MGEISGDAFACGATVRNANLSVARHYFYFARDENPTFQIRSSWPQLSRFERFQRLYFSTTYVFPMNANIPTPPASTIFIYAIFNFEPKEEARGLPFLVCLDSGHPRTADAR
jgi:hypothetical protein